MPIKFPRFSRRKSVGNSLEAGYEPANQGNNHDEPDPGRNSGSGFRILAQRNRSSGQTTSSAYSGTDYGGSSNRLSSNSTLPSTDAPRTPDDYMHRSQTDLPIYGGSKQAQAGARRSTGNSLSPNVYPNNINVPKLETSLDTSSIFGDDMFDFDGPKKGNRNRSQDAIGLAAPKIASNSIVNSSGAIPPVPKAYNPNTTAATSSPPSPSAYSNIFTSSHLDSDVAPTNESSPYHCDPKPTGDHGASNITSNSARNARNLTPGQKPPPVGHSRTGSLEAPTFRSSARPKVANHDTSGLKRNSALMRGASFPYEDHDAIIVSNSSSRNDIHNVRPHPAHSKTAPASLEAGRHVTDELKDRDSGWEETIPTGSSHTSVRSSGSSKGVNQTTPMISHGNAASGEKQGRVATQPTDDPQPEEEFDLSISVAASLAARYESAELSPSMSMPTNKVMTRAQFERYQQQQDEERILHGRNDDSDESDYEEETEVEKSKEIARQRARQEAHLAVYRQQMMKISGTDPSDAPLLGIKSAQASMSTPVLSLNQISIDPGSSGKNSDEEDEEVPLAILLAHGFPSKNRPPTRLSNASSQPNLRAVAQNQQDQRLPVFARHLPADPYNVGASLVNPSNRLSLAFGGGSDARSNSGGSVYNGMPPSPGSGRSPQGLVGEIVRVQEMKAARRGGGQASHFSQQSHDPYKQDPFERPASRGGGMLGLGGGMPSPVGMGNNIGNGMMNNGMGHSAIGSNGMGSNMGMGMGMGMGGANLNSGMGMPGNPMTVGGMPMGAGMVGPAPQQDQMHAQMQMQQQYMQMQMQYMQMQLQMQNNPQAQPQMPMMDHRPISMVSMNNHMSSLGVPQPGPRAMSMMNNNQHPQLQVNNMTNYTPSISPSRLAPNAPNQHGFLGPAYTPSLAPSERSNVGLPSRYRPVSYQNGNSTGSRTSNLPGPSHLKNATADSDDDDESAWQELNKKRKEKKDGGRKKNIGGLKGMLNFGSTPASIT